MRRWLDSDFLLFGQVAFQFHVGMSPEDFRTRLRDALDLLPLDALLAGWDRSSHFWESCVDETQRRGIELYLWRPILANLPSGLQRMGTQGLHNAAGGVFVSPHLRGPAGHFEFICPNHPESPDLVASIVQSDLKETSAQGLFLDKIRYPSPAAGLKASLSCFCLHCVENAGRRGLSLTAVQERLEALLHSPTTRSTLYALGIGGRKPTDPLIDDWQNFRSSVITQFVEKIIRQARDAGCNIGLDLFTPFLSELVGQDYRRLAPLADWIKPMIYCRSVIPSGLPIEIHGIIEGLGDDARVVVGNVLGETIPDSRTLLSGGLPLALAAREAMEGQRLACDVPSLAGIEVASRPGICRIDPNIVGTYGRLLRANGCRGVVACPDILLAAHDNLKALSYVLS